MTPLGRLPEPFWSAPFTVAEALEKGASYGELCHRDVVTLSRSIKILTDDADVPLALLTRPYTVVTGYAAASHATAFRIWEFPGFLPGADDANIHISRQSPHIAPRRLRVKGHQTKIRNDEVCFLNGLWITTRIRTWLDCAAKMSVEELVVVADHLIRIPRLNFEGRTQPYATIKELEVLLARHHGSRGIIKAREALRLARVGSDSPQETKLRLACGYAGLPEPLLNVETPLSNGADRTPDQSYPEYKIAVEYDGDTHNDPTQVERDVRRAEDYASAGWQEVHIMKRHMTNDAKEAVKKVRDALYARGWRPS
ncbi:hypothetical protein ACT3TS_06195 [Specibacter sp. AOP5-B1-6]|uniref:hypothetical protein n=1 Tax=Specibacter sp. AOP5-B1-6 TaxID=3457653 RepID=UPI00402BBED0